MKLLYLSLCFFIVAACQKDSEGQNSENNGSEVIDSNGAGHSQQEENNKDTYFTDTIKIMSFNIRHGAPVGHDDNDIHLEGIAAVINNYKPDIVALQEVDDYTNRAPFKEVKILGEATGMYSFFAKAIDFQGGEYGVAVLSKFPILSKKNNLLPMPDPSGEQRTIGVVKIKIDSLHELYFGSTHLELKEVNRVAQINKILEISNQLNAPFIIAGDFNATPDKDEIKTLQEGFVFSCSKNCSFTFRSDNPTKRIDYIALNAKANSIFEILDSKVLTGVLASDHLPIVTKLKIK